MADDQETPSGTLGRIALKQVRVSREDAPAKSDSRPGNPMNALVPYLDLFSRLGDDELARLARVEVSVVGELRRQVEEIDRALARYVDLLPRLNDADFVRLTGASLKTIRFWRLCHPRSASETSVARPNPMPVSAPETSSSRSHSAGGEAVLGVPSHTPVDRTPAPIATRGAGPAAETGGQPERAATPKPAANHDRVLDKVDDDDIVFALIDDDDEQAVTQAQPDAAVPTSSEDEDDLAFELSDDDFY